MTEPERIDFERRMRIGTAIADFTLCRIAGSTGENSVEPKVMEVLKVLVERRGEPVARDELIEAVWTGKFGGEERLSRAISLLRKTLGDVQGRHTHIETVPRFGYRLIAQVEPLKDAEKTIAAANLRWSLPRLTLMAAAVGFTVVLGLTWMGPGITANVASNTVSRDTNPALLAQTPDDRSIAVLPFADLSPAGDQRYFSDGLAEEVLDALANVDGLSVAGRTSSFAYRDANADIREIGQALGVAFLLEGSVRKQADQLRVTAQLIRTDDGFHAWSKTYDGNVADIFDFQEDVARSIALAMTPDHDAGSERLAPPLTSSREAYDLYLQGREMSRRFGVDNKLAAIDLLKQATAIDPEFAEAWAWLANSYIYVPVARPAEDPIPVWNATKDAVNRALAADPNIAMGHYVNALLAAEELRIDEAVASMERAYTAAPNTPFFAIRRGYYLALIGQVERGAAQMEAGLRLDPTDAPGLNNLGWAKIHLGETEAGLAMIDRAVSLGFDPARIGRCSFIAAMVTEQDGYTCFLETPQTIRGRYPEFLRSEAGWETFARAMAFRDPGAKSFVLPRMVEVLEAGEHPSNTYSLGVLYGLGEGEQFIKFLLENRSMMNSSSLYALWTVPPGWPSVTTHQRFP
ncbi:MAG: winged helix-turn-helix domain-containing protein, partial [Pseudomonadota bacterium]